MLVALELNDRVYDMLQYLWSCKSALLINVADENNRTPLLLAKRSSAEAHSRTCDMLPWRRFHATGLYGLDGIYDDNLRLSLLDVLKDTLKGSLTEQQEVLPSPTALALFPSDGEVFSSSRSALILT